MMIGLLLCKLWACLVLFVGRALYQRNSLVAERILIAALVLCLIAMFAGGAQAQCQMVGGQMVCSQPQSVGWYEVGPAFTGTSCQMINGQMVCSQPQAYSYGPVRTVTRATARAVTRPVFRVGGRAVRGAGRVFCLGCQ